MAHFTPTTDDSPEANPRSTMAAPPSFVQATINGQDCADAAMIRNLAPSDNQALAALFNKCADLLNQDYLRAAGHPPWPEWLSADGANMHTMIENAIKDGMRGCYQSADSAGMDWTEDGLLSCEASSVLNALRRGGWMPPTTIPPAQPKPMPYEETDELPDE